MKIKETLLIRQHFFDRRAYAGKLLLKILLFCCGFLIVLPFTLQSQNYLPLVSENKSWNCAYEIFDWQESYTIRFEGDTVINGFDYKRIIRDRHFYHSSEIIGYIKEDTLGKVYAMNNSFEEGILFDFGAGQGDTIVVHNTIMDWWDYDCPWFAELTIVVDTVYTIESLDGMPRRVSVVQRINDSFQEYWIEGIGSLAGVTKSGTYLFEELSCPPFLRNYLMCYFEDDSLVYYHDYYDHQHNCRHSSTINVEETARNTTPVKIIPNPITGGFFHLESSEPFQGGIFIYNALGKMVYKTTVHLPETNIRVPTASLAPGIYVVKLACKNGKTFSASKFIVSNR